MENRQHTEKRKGKNTPQNRRHYVSLRERRRRRRRRQIILRAAAACGTIVLVILGVSLFMVLGRHDKKAPEKPEDENAKLLEQYYADFIADAGGTEKKKTGFSSWFLENCGEDAWKKISGKLGGASLKETDFYEITGKTLHVLSDMYQGRLKDEKTAAKHHIYIRENGEKKAAGLLIAGDICLEEDDFVIDYYDEVQELNQCISPEILQRTNEADVFLLNHEYCISDRGEPLEGKYYTFRADPKRMKLIEELGTDMVSLANNHVYDFGADAFSDTMELLLQSGIPYVGGGHDIEEAKQPVYFVANGVKIGFVAASRAEKTRYTPQAEEDAPGGLLMYESEEFAEVIEKASLACDYLIAYVHWGTEDSNQFEDYQHDQAEVLLDSGADMIIGSHPHVLQGIEFIKGKPVIYSMGDFWFNGETKYTGLLDIKVTGEGLSGISFVPCRQTEYTTRYLAEKEEQRELYDYLEELSVGVKIGDGGEIQEESHGGFDR